MDLQYNIASKRSRRKDKIRLVHLEQSDKSAMGLHYLLTCTDPENFLKEGPTLGQGGVRQIFTISKPIPWEMKGDLDPSNPLDPCKAQFYLYGEKKKTS